MGWRMLYLTCWERLSIVLEKAVLNNGYLIVGHPRQ